MPDFVKIFATLSQHLHADLSRSDVLRVLIWPVLVLILGLIGLVRFHAPTWLLVIPAVLLGAFLLLYAGSFLFLLVCDRDALRSEKYSLHKMAIQQGLYGDSQIGLIDPATPTPAELQTSKSATLEGEDQ